MENNKNMAFYLFITGIVSVILGFLPTFLSPFFLGFGITSVLLNGLYLFLDNE